jgi:hypothetical protein
MDARQVLQSTLAPDAAERSNAEQQLAHAAEVDFVCVSPLPPLVLPRVMKDFPRIPNADTSVAR